MTEQIDPKKADANAGGNEAGGETRTFTQAEVNQLITDRIKREREKFAGFDDLKAKAEKWAEFEESQKSETDKLREALDKAKAERDETQKRANARLLEAEFIRAATVAGVKYPRDAYLLAQADKLEFGFDGDKIIGVEEAVKALLDNGRLVIDKPRAPSLNGGAGGGERAGERLPGLTEDEKEFARKMGLTEEQYAKSKKR